MCEGVEAAAALTGSGAPSACRLGVPLTLVEKRVEEGALVADGPVSGGADRRVLLGAEKGVAVLDPLARDLEPLADHAPTSFAERPRHLGGTTDLLLLEESVSRRREGDISISRRHPQVIVRWNVVPVTRRGGLAAFHTSVERTNAPGSRATEDC